MQDTHPISAESPLRTIADQGLSISLCLLLFSLPLAYITAVREITFGLAVFFWLTQMVLHRKVFLYRTPLDIPLLFWLGAALLSLVWAVDPAYSFREIQKEILRGMVLFYLVYYGLNREDRRKQFYLTLILGNGLMVFWGIWDFFNQGGSLHEFEVRAGSLHSGYGTLGTYLITVFPFLLIGFFSPLVRKFRWPLMVLILGNIFCIYITFGRAMWLALAVEGAVMGFFLFRKWAILGLILALVVFFFLIPRTVWFHGEKLPTAEGTSQSIGGTAGDLVDVWKLAFKHLGERPFKGIGLGRDSFSMAFTEFRASHQPLLWHAHNTFLNIFFQTGLQGLAVFLWLVISILYFIFQRSKEGLASWPGMLAMSALIMVLGFFVRNGFDDFYVDDNALMFWYLIGGALAGLEKPKKKMLARA